MIVPERDRKKWFLGPADLGYAPPAGKVGKSKGRQAKPPPPPKASTSKSKQSAKLKKPPARSTRGKKVVDSSDDDEQAGDLKSERCLQAAFSPLMEAQRSLASACLTNKRL